MLTLVGAFAGVRLLGFSGVLLGPLSLSYFFELVQLNEEEHGGENSAAIEERQSTRGLLASTRL